MTEKSASQSHTAVWGGAFSAFGSAFEQLKANSRPAILFVAVYVAISIIEIVTLGTDTKGAIVAASYEGLVSLLFLLALPVYGLAIADGKKIDLGEFMRFDAKKYFTLILVGILYALIVFGSLLLLIIPAIWTIAWFALSAMAVVDKRMGPIAALKESKRLAQNHKAKVWGIIGASILFAIAASILSIVPIVGAIVSVVASALVTILTTAATAKLYRWAQHQAQ